MAVYTVLDRHDIEAFIEPYGIGPLLDFEGVAAGIENTNYFLSTDQSQFPSELRTTPVGRYVLTIFERVKADDLSFYVDLTTMLNRNKLPVPCPIKDANGEALHKLSGKPALLVPRLSGAHPHQTTLAQCTTIGTTLARVHLACLAWPCSHTGIHDFNWLRRTANEIAAQLDADEQQLLTELPRFEQLVADYKELPQAVIHGDLFRDNALFDGDTVTGLIDFNSAGNGFLAMDLAIVVNDWCSEADGRLNGEKANHLLNAYQAVRTLEECERRLWNDFLRIAALRFWLSRRATELNPQNSHRPGGLVELKDPLEFKNILLHRIKTPHHLA